MKPVYLSKEYILEIYKDGEKYILKYPTFNITMPEVVAEISKEAVESYLAGEHTGKELINYAHNGFWKSEHQLTQEESDREFLREHPSLILNDIESNKLLFPSEELEELLKKAYEISASEE